MPIKTTGSLFRINTTDPAWIERVILINLTHSHFGKESLLSGLVTLKHPLNFNPIFAIVLFKNAPSRESPYALATKLFLHLLGRIGINHSKRPNLHFIRPFGVPSTHSIYTC